MEELSETAGKNELSGRKGRVRTEGQRQGWVKEKHSETSEKHTMAKETGEKPKEDVLMEVKGR